MATVAVILLNGEIFDLQIGLSDKQLAAVHNLIRLKNDTAKEKGLEHKWELEDFDDLPDIVEFIDNIKKGYIPGHSEPEFIDEMSKGSI